jgi:hypothetical protein
VSAVLVIVILIIYCNRKAMRKSKQVNVENVMSRRVDHVSPVITPRQDSSITDTIQFFNQSDFWPVNDRERFQYSRKHTRKEELLVETVL